MRPRSRGSEALRAGLLAVASLGVCLLLLELGLRLFWGGHYEKYDPSRPWDEYEFHPVRGYTLGPDVERYDTHREYAVWLRHNHAGFRSPEIPVEKPAGRLRVLVIGDSQTYGTGVENDEAFPQVLEQLDPSLQVINAGVPGYGTGKQLLLLREMIEEWSPDLVVLAYFWNDLFDVQHAGYNRAELRDGRVVFIPPDPASPEHPAFRIYNRRQEKREGRYAWVPADSRLYRLVSDRMKLLRYALQARFGEQENADTGHAFAEGEEEQAWPLAFALIREMARLCEQHGTRFAVFVIPDQVQVEPEVVVYGVPDALWRIQERIAEFGEREGVVVMDPLDALRARRQRGGRPLYHRTDRHLNPEGQRHVAELLHRELSSLGLIDGRG